MVSAYKEDIVRFRHGILYMLNMKCKLLYKVTNFLTIHQLFIDWVFT